jgi:hypothetical protein
MMELKVEKASSKVRAEKRESASKAERARTTHHSWTQLSLGEFCEQCDDYLTEVRCPYPPAPTATPAIRKPVSYASVVKDEAPAKTSSYSTSRKSAVAPSPGASSLKPKIPGADYSDMFNFD